MDRHTMHAYESAAAGALARPCGVSARMFSAWQLKSRCTRTNGKRNVTTVPARRPLERTD